MVNRFIYDFLQFFYEQFFLFIDCGYRIFFACSQILFGYR